MPNQLTSYPYRFPRASPFFCPRFCYRRCAAVREPPFPNLLEIHPDMAENESSLFDNETYPTLDLQTTEFSREQTPGSQILINPRTGHRGSAQEHFSTNQAPADESRAIRKRHAGTVYLRPAWYRVCRHKRIFVTYKG